MSESWRLPTHASLFGKLPTVLDYVRVNHSYPPAIALDEWMSRALSDLTVANLSWPSARFRFLFAPSGSEHALLGVFGPSRDRAGRKFPLSIFAPVPVAAIARRFAALPRAQEFFTAAEALLDEAPNLSRDAAAERLEQLPTLTPDTLDGLHEELQVALDDRSHASVVQDLYGGAEHEAEDAFSRAASTFAKHRSAAPERAFTLDCPIASTEDVCAWTSLAEVCLSWSLEVPSLFWTGQADPGRLLISLGTPLPLLPLWLADRKRKNERLVSLHSLTATSGSTGAPGVWTPPPEVPAATASAQAVWTPPPEVPARNVAAEPVWTPPPPAPAPSHSAPTPVRAPLPVPGAGTPPQGFAIAPPRALQDAAAQHAHDEDSVTAAARWEHDAAAEARSADAYGDWRGDEDAPDRGLDRAAASAFDRAAASGDDTDYTSAPGADQHRSEEDGSPYVGSMAQPPPAVPSAPPTPAQPRGMSLWRKLRALAASG